MPTPFDLLADLSKLGSKRFVTTQAEELAKQSIAADTLRHSSQSPSAKIIHGVLRKKFSTDKPILCRILQTTGSDVIGALRKHDVWDSAREGRFGEKEKAVLVLQNLAQEAKLPFIYAVAPNPERSELGGPSDDNSKFPNRNVRPVAVSRPNYFKSDTPRVPASSSKGNCIRE